MKKKKKVDPLDEFDFFDIDPNNLVEECGQQPKLFFKYAALLAKEQRKESACKADREVVEADLNLEIRTTWDKKFPNLKMTETVVIAKMKKSSEYREAQKKLRNIRYKVALYFAAVNSLNHRKSMLENDTKLHGQNYFATPFVGETVQKQIEESTKKKARTKKSKK